MIRLRIALVGLMALVLAIWAGDVFDRRVWTLLACAALPIGASLLTIEARWFVRLPAAVTSVVVAIGVVAFVEGGGFGDILVPVSSGLRRILSTEWPSPVRPDLAATVGFVVAVVTTLSAELARRPRLHLAPIGPMLLGAVVVIALAAPRGAAVVWPTALAILSAALAALGTRGAITDRLRLLRGERRLAAVIAVVAAVVAAVSIPLSLGGRADPRDTEEPDRTAALLDPIEATLALQRIDPPVDLHRVDLGGDAPLPTRWRTSALADYDGRRWTPDLTLRPIGRRLATDAEIDGPTIDASVEFLDDDLQLVPLPGRPVIVDAEIETDEARTLVRLVERPGVGSAIDITSTVEPDTSELLIGGLATREIDDSVSGLADVAETLGEAADGDDEVALTVEDRLRNIEATMRDDFVLDPEAPGGGLQRALIDRFLRETQRGNAEQFATAFALLAKASGVDARVATGFVVDPTRVDGDQVTFSSDDAAIWPEVRIGADWLAFDPVPEVPLSDQAAPPIEPTVQSPAAPQPPIAPPPDDIDESVETTDEGDELVAGGVSTVVEVLVRAAAIAGLVLLPVLLLLLIVIGIKWRRKRRRLAGTPVDRIRGAWTEATDQLIDAGMAVGPAMTNLEIAQAGRPHAPAATRELDRLATLSTAATFGEPARPDLLADDAAACLAVVERSVDLDRSLRAKVRRRLSLRSLRSETRSPV